MKKILNFGSLNLDYTYAVEHFVCAGETLAAGGLTVNCGGKGLNQSIAAARAGAVVYHAGKIGQDGKSLKEALNKNGVNTDFLFTGNGPNGHAMIQVNSEGQNCILLFAGSNHEIEKKEIDACLNHFDPGDWLILQNEINNIPYLLNKASQRGMKIVLNPSPITKEIFEYPLEKASVLVLNEIEGSALSGGETETDAILSKLRVRYPDTDVLLSLGKAGAVFFDGEKKIKHGIYRAPVVDTTAAGDTMLGYFAAGLVSGLSPETALKRASIAASIAISRPGAAASIPLSSEIDSCDFEYLG